MPGSEELSAKRSRGTGPRATGVESAAKRSRGTGPRATGVERAANSALYSVVSLSCVLAVRSSNSKQDSQDEETSCS